MVGVLRRATRHAARVVGDDTANRARHLARRVGAELASVSQQSRIHLTHRGTRLHARNGTLIFDVNATKVGARIDEHAIGRGLSREAGPAGAKRHRARGSRRKAQNVGDFGDAVRHEDRVRCEQVV